MYDYVRGPLHTFPTIVIPHQEQCFRSVVQLFALATLSLLSSVHAQHLLAKLLFPSYMAFSRSAPFAPIFNPSCFIYQKKAIQIPPLTLWFTHASTDLPAFDGPHDFNGQDTELASQLWSSGENQGMGSSRTLNEYIVFATTHKQRSSIKQPNSARRQQPCQRHESRKEEAAAGRLQQGGPAARGWCGVLLLQGDRAGRS
eukprot:1161698-Pelagomonas_calceolata.AAC.11